MLLEDTRLQKFFQKLKTEFIPKNNTNRPKYFLSFRDDIKLGIRPTNSFITRKRSSHGLFIPEPRGIYTLPLKNWKDMRKFLTDPDLYFLKRKYIFVLTFSPQANVLYLGDFPYPSEFWDDVVEQAEEKYGSSDLSVSITKYLLKDMGINVVVDNVGSILSPIGEKYQAVFLLPSSMKVLDIFTNDDSETVGLLGKYYKSKSLFTQEFKEAIKNFDKERIGKFLKILLPSKEIKKIKDDIKDFIENHIELFGKIDMNILPDMAMYPIYLHTGEKLDFDPTKIRKKIKKEYEVVRKNWNKKKFEKYQNFVKKYKLSE